MSYNGYDSLDEFDVLLSDLSSDLDYTSSEDRSLESGFIQTNALKHSNADSRVTKTKHQNKKRKIDVLTDRGDVVTFEAGFPRPRIVKTDIRRSYSSMYAHVMNSGDFGLMFGFFDTFCCPAFSYSMTKENIIGAMHTTKFSFLRCGIAACSQFWLFHMLTVPDAAFRLIDTNVFTADGDDSGKIVSTFSFKATKIFDCSPIFKCQSIEGSEVQSSSHFEKESAETVKANIKSAVDSIVGTLALRSEPLPLESTGELTLHLNSDKRLVKIEMVARSHYTEYEYNSLMSKHRISY